MIYRYKLLRGVHSTGRFGSRDNPLRTYQAGDEFESATDLSKVMNLAGYPPRIQLLETAAGPSAEDRVIAVEQPVGQSAPHEGNPLDGLDGMSVQQLRETAKALKVDLGSESRRGRIIDLIRRRGPVEK